MPLVVTESEGKLAVNGSYLASINPADGKCLQEKYGDKYRDCDFGLLGNLYACEGKPGKVSGNRVTSGQQVGVDIDVEGSGLPALCCIAGI